MSIERRKRLYDVSEWVVLVDERGSLKKIW